MVSLWLFPHHQCKLILQNQWEIEDWVIFRMYMFMWSCNTCRNSLKKILFDFLSLDWWFLHLFDFTNENLLKLEYISLPSLLFLLVWIYSCVQNQGCSWVQLFYRTTVCFIISILPFLCCIFHFHYASINALKYAKWFHMKNVSHFNQFSIKGFRLAFSRLVRRVFINLSVMPSLISV